MPAVSAIIPTFERRDVVVGAIESALAQSLAEREVIVVDDGSRDGTPDALEKRFGDRIRLLRRPHAGASAARNAGVEAATGRYLAFLDSDARWLPDHLETLAGALEAHTEASLACTGYGHPSEWGAADAGPQLVDELPSLVRRSTFGYVSLSCCAICRDTAGEVGGFDERLVVAEDYDLFVRLALNGPFAVMARTPLAEGVACDDSLGRLGRREGLYLDAKEICLDRLVELLAASSRADREALAAEARAWRAVLAGVRALGTRDDAAAREAFALACRLFPSLDEEPAAVAAWLRNVTPRYYLDPEVRYATFERAASLWPRRHSPTARVLRIKSLDAAFELGRMRAALRASLHSSPRQAPSAARHLLWLARQPRPG
jgi:glycosyltransferase involved in cell wall biosynthesis